MKTFSKSNVLILLVLVFSFGIGTAYGAKFPEKPITLVVHAAPGGGSDQFARFISASFEKHKLLPQPIAVENKPGGAAAVSMAYVAGKKKDPYYLLTATGVFLLTPLQGLSQINYKDFTPICNLSYDEHMLMVSYNSKFKSIKDIVDYGKANPEKLTIGGSFAGGTESINTYRFEKAAGIKIKYVGFTGSGDSIVALLGGHIDMSFGSPSEVMELVKANKVRILGSFTDKRFPYTPEIPTVMEQGINVTGLGMNRAIVAPVGIPEDARKTLEDAFSKLAKTEDYKKFHKDNMVVEGWMDSATFGKYLEKRNAEYSVILKDMGLLKVK